MGFSSSESVLIRVIRVSVPGQVIRGVAEQTIFPAFLGQDQFPELVGLGEEDDSALVRLYLDASAGQP